MPFLKKITIKLMVPGFLQGFSTNESKSKSTTACPFIFPGAFKSIPLPTTALGVPMT